MTIIAFTDGSAMSNGKINSKGGIGIYFPNCKFSNVSLETNKALETLKINKQKITNNVSELTAIYFLLNLVKNDLIHGKNVIIKSDSQYCIKSLTIWYKNWEKNGYKNSTKKQISNYILIYPMINEYIKVYNKQIKFEHVLAHKTKPKENSKEYLDWHGNFMADYLASHFT
jgi:ribonuclease HI